jgi:hypothetical protein
MPRKSGLTLSAYTPQNTQRRRACGNDRHCTLHFALCAFVSGVLFAVVDQIDAFGRQHRKLLLNAIEVIQAGSRKSVRRLID